jgi:peptide/nickel transport system permease protein
MVTSSVDRPTSRLMSVANFVNDYRIGTVGVFLVLLTTALVTLGPLVWTLPVETQDLAEAFRPPSAEHPLGTDQLGRDLLSRTLSAGRLSLVIGLGSVLLGLVVGVAAGVLAAMSGRVVRTLILRSADALLALPGIVQAVVLVAVLGRGALPLVVALAVYTIPIFARISYTATLQILHQDYIAAARWFGRSNVDLVRSHILPNIASPVVAVATLRVGGNLLVAAALNYFGLGVQPPTPEWGLMVADGQAYSSNHPELLLVPGICIFVASLGFNLLGDGIRDWLDPRLQAR